MKRINERNSILTKEKYLATFVKTYIKSKGSYARKMTAITVLIKIAFRQSQLANCL